MTNVEQAYVHSIEQLNIILSLKLEAAQDVIEGLTTVLECIADGRCKIPDELASHVLAVLVRDSGSYSDGE